MMDIMSKTYIPCWTGFDGWKLQKNNRGQPRFWGEDKLEGSPTDLRGRASTRLKDMFRLGFWIYTIEWISYVVYIKEGRLEFRGEEERRDTERVNGWRRKLRDSLEIENFREAWGQVLFWGEDVSRHSTQLSYNRVTILAT